jgi:copper transport protein
VDGGAGTARRANAVATIRSPHRVIRRALTAALLAAGLVLLTAAPASAHAILLASSPSDHAHLETPPTTVSLTFNEPVDAPLGAVRVIDQNRKRVDNGDVRAVDKTVTVGLEGIGDGCFVVSWRAISADSHPVRGAFNFSVGSADSSCSTFVDDSSDRRFEIAGAIARFFAYGGTLLAAGGVLFLTVLHDRGDDAGALARVVRGAGIVGAGGVLATLPVQAALATGLGITAITNTSVLGDVAADGVGLAAALALAGLVAVVAAPRRRSVALPGAAIAAVSFAFAGHTTTTDPRWLSISADVVHVLTASAWVGGVVLLTLMLRLRHRAKADPVPTGRVVDRFTTMATITVLAVTVTGVALGWSEVRALRALTSTTYGRLLMVKAALAAIVALIGAYNHYRLVPALQRATAQGRSLWRHLLRTVRIEAAGMVVVLALTAVLVNVTPARTAAGIGTIFSDTKPIGSNSVNLVVDPNRAGENSIHLYLLDASGRPAPLAQKVTLELSLPSSEIGPLDEQPFVAGPGHYQLNTSDLSVSGTWTIVVRAQVSDFREDAAKFDVTVNP